MNYEQALHDFYVYAKGAGSGAPHSYLIRFNQKVKASPAPTWTKNLAAMHIQDGIRKGANYKEISARVLGDFKPAARGTIGTAQLVLSI